MAVRLMKWSAASCEHDYRRGCFTLSKVPRMQEMPKVNTDNILGKAPGSRTVDQDYHFGKVLGKGAFGVVRSATSRSSAEKFACKSIAKSKLVCREDVQDVQREVAIMNHVAGHPNVVNSKV